MCPDLLGIDVLCSCHDILNKSLFHVLTFLRHPFIVYCYHIQHVINALSLILSQVFVLSYFNNSRMYCMSYELNNYYCTYKCIGQKSKPCLQHYKQFVLPASPSLKLPVMSKLYIDHLQNLLLVTSLNCSRHNSPCLWVSSCFDTTLPPERRR